MPRGIQPQNGLEHQGCVHRGIDHRVGTHGSKQFQSFIRKLASTRVASFGLLA